MSDQSAQNDIPKTDGPKVRRDSTKLSSETGYPLCYGHQSSSELVCMMCPCEQPCREERKKAGGSQIATTGFFSQVVDRFDDDLDDDDDDDLEEDDEDL